MGHGVSQQPEARALRDPREARRWLLVAFCLLAGARSAVAAPPVQVTSATYGAGIDYHGSSCQDHSYLLGQYVALGYGLEHVLEAEEDRVQKSYHGYPSLQQWDTTVAYTNYGIPGLKLRLGAHCIRSDDPLTDDGGVGFGGVEYYRIGRWTAGAEGYFSTYPGYQDRLDVVQLTPHLGVTVWRGAACVWGNDLRGYWIHPERKVVEQHRFLSLEDRVCLTRGRWTFGAFGWAGEQVFAVRNDGFALYNLAEEHKAGYGVDVRYVVGVHLAWTLRASREVFREAAGSANATATTYMAMLSLGF